MRLRVATRGSQLALAQTAWVVGQLQRIKPGIVVDVIRVVTRGDRESERSLAEIGGKGLFVTEIEAAIQEGRADVAIHSLKDMPAELGEGLVIACVPRREDPRDVLLTNKGEPLEALVKGDTVGTNSLRRRVQLRRLRPDLDYAFLRGNIDTRIAKLERGEYRAIVLAYAGLRRLGLSDRPLYAFSVEELIPAVGQGALALETRADDQVTRSLLAPLEDPEARATAEAERTFLHALGGDCNVPLAGHARVDRPNNRLRFDAMVGSTDPGPRLTASVERTLDNGARDLVHEARDLGREAAAALLSQGAAAFIQQARGVAQPGSDPRSRPAPH